MPCPSLEIPWQEATRYQAFFRAIRNSCRNILVGVRRNTPSVCIRSIFSQLFLFIRPLAVFPSFYFSPPPLFMSWHVPNNGGRINVTAFPGCCLKETVTCVRVLACMVPYRTSKDSCTLSSSFANTHTSRDSFIKKLCTLCGDSFVTRLSVFCFRGCQITELYVCHSHVRSRPCNRKQNNCSAQDTTRLHCQFVQHHLDDKE